MNKKDIAKVRRVVKDRVELCKDVVHCKDNLFWLELPAELIMEAEDTEGFNEISELVQVYSQLSSIEFVDEVFLGVEVRQGTIFFSTSRLGLRLLPTKEEVK